MVERLPEEQEVEGSIPSLGTSQKNESDGQWHIFFENLEPPDAGRQCSPANALGRVVQWVEQRTLNPRVGGSNPSASTSILRGKNSVLPLHMDA